MTVAELRTQAKELGIKGYSKLRKEQLMEEIRNAKANEMEVQDMTYQQFKNRVQTEILDFMPDDYADAKVSINKVTKNNMELDGLVIYKGNGGISPTIYLNDEYEDYCAGTQFDRICSRIATAYLMHVTETPDMSAITNWEKAKLIVEPRLFSADNVKFMQERAYVPFAEDLIITFAVPVKEMTFEDASASVPVTKSLANNWGVSTEKILEYAIANISENTKFIGMTELMLNDMGMSPEQAAMFGLDTENEHMYVLTNKAKLNGAAALLVADKLEEIRERIGDNFYILPSSVHEVIIVPNTDAITPDELEDMVMEVNATEVSPQDKLSDSVYQYANGIINKI